MDYDFAGLSGGRVVRIATHPDFQGMGYGSRALQLLLDYFEGRLPSLGEGGGDTLDPLPEVKVFMLSFQLHSCLQVCKDLSTTFTLRIARELRQNLSKNLWS